MPHEASVLAHLKPRALMDEASARVLSRQWVFSWVLNTTIKALRLTTSRDRITAFPTALPLEIEEVIFKTAARGHRRSITWLILVAKRVQIW